MTGGKTMRLSADEFTEARALLDDLTRRIEIAPDVAKPIFRGIAWLHSVVAEHEAERQRIMGK